MSKSGISSGVKRGGFGKWVLTQRDVGSHNHVFGVNSVAAFSVDRNTTSLIIIGSHARVGVGLEEAAMF